MKIGRLKKVELREIWSREDTDFTNWLNDNLDILGEAIGLELEESETESSWSNSDFRVDISATTKENKKVGLAPIFGYLDCVNLIYSTGERIPRLECGAL